MLDECAPAARSWTTTVEPLHLGGVSFQDVAAYFRTREPFALLESQGESGPRSAYSFLCFSPFGRFTVRDDRTAVRLGTRVVTSTGDPLALLDDVMRRHAADPVHPEAPPFTGGAVGYIAYEFGRHLEKLPRTAVDDLGLPDCDLSLYNFTIAEHRESGTLCLCHLQAVDDPIGPTRDEVMAELRAVPPGFATRRPARPRRPPVSVQPGMTTAEYLAAIDRIKTYIRAGDVYQVNMTQRFVAPIGDADPWDISRRLATINPAPFAAFLNGDGHAIVSSSPERFIRVEDGRIETRPIKGTIRRGDSASDDERLRERLSTSPKDRAELAMIVDLMRNDLGRICAPGTVRVRAFPEVESHASLHHLVAAIEGQLDDGVRATDVLRATFPGGSITGCPKIRAMEIIDELEPAARGVYTGSIGYLGFDGRLDLNIAIRTLVVKDGHAYIHAGGGVVADSNREDEYAEAWLKAARLIDAVQAVASGEPE